MPRKNSASSRTEGRKNAPAKSKTKVSKVTQKSPGLKSAPKVTAKAASKKSSVKAAAAAGHSRQNGKAPSSTRAYKVDPVKHVSAEMNTLENAGKLHNNSILRKLPLSSFRSAALVSKG